MCSVNISKLQLLNLHQKTYTIYSRIHTILQTQKLHQQLHDVEDQISCPFRPLSILLLPKNYNKIQNCLGIAVDLQRNITTIPIEFFVLILN